MQPKTERLILGVGCASLLATAAIGWLSASSHEGQLAAFLAGCFRLGLVLGALWLAHPHFNRLPNPLVVLLVLVAVVIAVVRWKMMIPVAILTAGAILVLRALKRSAAPRERRP